MLSLRYFKHKFKIMNIAIRAIIQADIPHLKAVLNSIELFPAELLEDMMADYFTNPETQDIWFTVTENDIPISIAYCAPEQMTVGTYNLHAIGVKNTLQSKGIGQKMMQYLENRLQQAGHRILIVDTSGTEDFIRTRKFYEHLGYTKEAVIRDFWAAGDDKVTYWKQLN